MAETWDHFKHCKYSRENEIQGQVSCHGKYLNKSCNLDLALIPRLIMMMMMIRMDDDDDDADDDDEDDDDD